MKSRSPTEIQRRCNTLLSLVEKEDDDDSDKKKKPAAGAKSNGEGKAPGKGKRKAAVDTGSANTSRASTPAGGAGPSKKARK